jgi:hypothetical protein
LESIDGSYLSLKEHRDIFVAAFASEDNSRAPDRWEFEEILGGFPEIVEDRELVELTLKADGGSLEHLPSTCQKDKELVRLAVVKTERTSSRNYGASTQNIEYASDDLKNDEELALLCADALRHLSDTMKNNEKVVRLALQRGAKIEDVCKKTLGVSCMFMWIILAALCFGAVFDGLGAVHAIESLFLEEWNLSPWEVLIMMQLSYIIMGMFLDDTAMLVIVAPLYVPLVIGLGFNPIWYGVLYTVTCQIAYMTPPFGYNLFLMRAMAPKEITLVDIYRSIIPFVLIMTLGLALIVLYPQIALWLPNLICGK